MKADLVKLRALLGLLDEVRMLVREREPGAAGHFQRKFEWGATDFLREHGAELLAIAEAVERAPVVDIYDSRAHGWTVDGDIPDKLNGISVRLLAIGEDG